MADYNLIAGPNKFDLMLALFNAGADNRVTFTIEKRQTGSCNSIPGTRRVFEANILSVEREDGSGESWNITGNASPIIDYDGYNCYQFKCYYSTKTRTGSFSWK